MRFVSVCLAAAFAIGLASSLPDAVLAQAPTGPHPPGGLGALASVPSAAGFAIAPALFGMVTSEDRSRSRRGRALGWVLVLGGAVAGGAVGFAVAAPGCLDGSVGCGSTPLVYAAIGSAVGAAAGWALHALVRSR